MPALTIAGAALVFIADPGGNFVGSWGALLAVMILFIGNVLSCALNASYVRRAGGPIWLNVVVWVQAIPLIAGAAKLGLEIADMRSRSEAFAQREPIRLAVAADDTAAFEAAWAKCEAACRAIGGGLTDFLYDAAERSASKTVALLIAPPYSARDGQRNPSGSEPTCDDNTVTMTDALGAAVARNDNVSLGLLLPLADDRSRRSAIWLAAQLDRYRMMQTMLAAGVPIDIRGEILDQNETLLVAAAEGAALRVGRWLIEEKSMPVDRITNGTDKFSGSGPLRYVLGRSHRNSESLDRTRAFVKLLVDHGANVDAKWSDDTSTAWPRRSALATAHW